jgi:AbrB family looped-hinge helix DNA binding protein
VNTVVISPKFQIVIPEVLRKAMSLKPGEKLRVMEVDGVLEYVPVRPLKEMKGAFKGMDTRAVRDKEWR